MGKKIKFTLTISEALDLKGATKETLQIGEDHKDPEPILDPADNPSPPLKMKFVDDTVANINPIRGDNLSTNVDWEKYKKQVQNDGSNFLPMPVSLFETLLLQGAHVKSDDSKDTRVAKQVIHSNIGTNTSVSGNLFTNINNPDNCKLTHFDGKDVDLLSDDNGIFKVTKDNKVLLTVYTKKYQQNYAGDFEYTQLKDTSNNSNYSYTFKNSFNISITMDLAFSTLDDSPSIGCPDFGSVDEEGLLPGTQEHTETIGSLNINFGATKGKICLSQLIKQNKLVDLNLTSSGIPLYYKLTDDNTKLVATAGANGDEVFEVSIEPSGNYIFTLKGHLDREPPPNLIDNGHDLSSESWVISSIDNNASHEGEEI